MRLVKDILAMMRPHQWIKNLFVFPALIFSKNLFHPYYLAESLSAFALFCAASGSIYIFNDIMDVEEDRHHPVKRQRPLAAGRVSSRAAWTASCLIAAASLALSFVLGTGFGAILLVYIVMNLGYSMGLKRVVIVDVLIVALGFVMRAAAGGVVLSVEVSPWLLACTILIALFLVLAKRRHELTLMDDRANMLLELSIASDDGDRAVRYRKSLEDYSPYFLDQMIAVTTASTLMCYILYTLSEDAIIKFGSHNLVYTVPFVIYGIFRYLYIIHRKREGGSPTRDLAGDAPLIVDVLLWGASVVAVLYI
ncbi:MAG: decaprenyl-phosphate phosphoribosyltransferase [Nitrospirae bacterium]|nr:decaprenyl-phosphate phosphoribosyltransferase [Nitrospirota bacterium]MBI5696666.1 decaprenyl-phosphate phosphoribosyltransferase [Nitrospirota bacterium]